MRRRIIGIHERPPFLERLATQLSAPDSYVWRNNPCPDTVGRRSSHCTVNEWDRHLALFLGYQRWHSGLPWLKFCIYCTILADNQQI